MTDRYEYDIQAEMRAAKSRKKKTLKYLQKWL